MNISIVFISAFGKLANSNNSLITLVKVLLVAKIYLASIIHKKREFVT